MATLKELVIRGTATPIRRAGWRAGVWIEPFGTLKAVIRSEHQSFPYAFSYEDFVADDWEIASPRVIPSFGAAHE